MVLKVISLERTPERLHAFLKNNNHLEFEVHNAIDGVALDKNSDILKDFFHQNIQYTNGAYGCALSHIQLWIECIEKNKDYTICEDDAILNKNFTSMTKEIINGLPKDWDICLWTWNLDSYLNLSLMKNIDNSLLLIDQSCMRVNQEIFKTEIYKSYPFRLINAFGTACYTISPSGAKNLINAILPLMPFELYFHGINKKIPNNGIDIAMNKVYKDFKSYVSVPPAAFTPNLHEISTVQNWP